MNNGIKKNRIKSYFIDSAKEIIINDGPENITVRNVAEKAGYSYATLYNYYKDIEELLSEVKKSMINDIKNYLNSKNNNTSSKNSLKSFFTDYVSYYVKYPNIFRFFYMYKNNTVSSPEISEDYISLFSEALNSVSLVKAENTELITKTCLYTVHGILLLFFSSEGISEDILHEDLKNFLEYIFD
ncbi:MAG: TetR/AcrR family transcriptional regulator [Thermotogae bacterium]|nr:TetR/AcrR family transcriptional regulator [Thermotogota bacterium]